MRSLYYGVLQQKMYLKQTDGSRFSDTAFVLLVQCVFNALAAGIWNVLAGLAPKDKAEDPPKRSAVPAAGARPPFLTTLFNPAVMLVSAIYVFAMFSSNESLKYVDYAYQALAKSCKLIPVMIGRVLIMNEKYSWVKYACVLAMTGGIGAYEFMKDGSGGGKHGGGGTTSSMGLALLAFSLFLDGCSGPGQESIKPLLSGPEQIIASNIWATVYMFIVTAGMGQLGSSVAYLRAHPDLTWTLVQFSISSALGQIFIFFTIREFDSLTLSTITTTRKFATIVVNAVVLPKDNHLNLNQWLCVTTVFGAVAFDTIHEYFEKGSKKKLEAPKKG